MGSLSSCSSLSSSFILGFSSSILAFRRFNTSIDSSKDNFILLCLPGEPYFLVPPAALSFFGLSSAFSFLAFAFSFFALAAALTGFHVLESRLSSKARAYSAGLCFPLVLANQVPKAQGSSIILGSWPAL